MVDIHPSVRPCLAPIHPLNAEQFVFFFFSFLDENENFSLFTSTLNEPLVNGCKDKKTNVGLKTKSKEKNMDVEIDGKITMVNGFLIDSIMRLWLSLILNCE